MWMKYALVLQDFLERGSEPMIARLFLLVLAVMIGFGQVAYSSTGKMSDGYDATDLDTPPFSYSAIIVSEYEAIGVALPELKQFSLELDKYKSIHIRETHKYIYVVFTANAINSPVFGTPPGFQPGIEVQILRENMQVTGTRRE
jgi:hypothetical protein